MENINSAYDQSKYTLLPEYRESFGTNSKKTETEIEQLQNLKDSHQIWHNPLLIACENGQLTLDDFRYIFSQYYLYSKNFTKLLAAAMINCDSDYHRSKLSENLWEEGGGQDVELRHAEIFREFLTSCLQISLENIRFESYTEHFFNQYLELCLFSDAVECLAALSFGTEGIVGRLYTVFRQGLLKAGLKDESLKFFNIHIECDDDHALTLEEMVLSHRNEKNWLERCKDAINQALDLRNIFFSNLYSHIQSSKLNNLVTVLASPNAFHDRNRNASQQLKSSIDSLNNRLYQNKDSAKNINFTVDRIPFNVDVLDPRIVHIPVGCNNELHSHAHETIFLILEGNAEVLVDENRISVKSGDIVFVPRWANHQTRNTGTQELKFLAITDYGLTKRFPQNTEHVYRQNKNNVQA